MRFIAILVASVTLAGCDVVGSPFDDTDQLVDAFHDAYNAQDFDKIYGSAGADIESQTDLRRIYEEFGAFVDSVTSKGSTSGGLLSPRVQYSVKSNFVRSHAWERFTFEYVDGEYRLIEYKHISEDEALKCDGVCAGPATG